MSVVFLHGCMFTRVLKLEGIAEGRGGGVNKGRQRRRLAYGPVYPRCFLERGDDLRLENGIDDRSLQRLQIGQKGVLSPKKYDVLGGRLKPP